MATLNVVALYADRTLQVTRPPQTGPAGAAGATGATGAAGPAGPAGPSVWGGITGTLGTQADLAAAMALKATLLSPTFTGTPAAPTAAPGTNTTQLSSTAFVQAAIAALIGAAPGALDTLSELADALADDANFAATVTTLLNEKLPLAGGTMTGFLTHDYGNGFTGSYEDQQVQFTDGVGVATVSTLSISIINGSGAGVFVFPNGGIQSVDGAGNQSYIEPTQITTTDGVTSSIITPTGITSPQFTGPLNGNATSATAASNVDLGGVTGLGTGVATFLATPNSANLRGALTDETGTGAAVFGTSPTLTTSAVGNAPLTLTPIASQTAATMKIDNPVSINPFLQWNAATNSQGISFKSGSTTIARFQDNGACFFGSFETLGGLQAGDFFIGRGANGGRHTFNYGTGATHEFTAVDGSTVSFARFKNVTAANPIMIFKGAASQTGDAIQVVNSADAVQTAFAANGAWKPPSLADASAANNTVYYSTTASKLVYKDAGGTVNNLY